MFAEPFLSGLHKMGVQLGLGATLVGCRKFSPPCSFYCTEDARSNYDNLQKLVPIISKTELRLQCTSWQQLDKFTFLFKHHRTSSFSNGK